MFLVVGLGNPGREYEKTRHNVGFEVIDRLAEKLGIEVNRIKFKGLVGEASVNGKKVVLLKPTTFMNLSGESLIEAVSFYKVNLENVIVIYDDVDINVGRLRIRGSGSDGGHNGMKNIIYHLKDNKFPRVRIGIGKPKGDMVSHVLGRFSQEEEALIKKVVDIAVEAVLEIINNSLQSAMNKYNSYDASLK
ncbi:peptidyl-tRNA hydrolase [Caloramator fervidus]|uniref:Peptidyl-tRNA hydrolase n=1 Tax=Caloramator fervidus TaxID=29344 RepID=A0A1H5UX92_9CLOT|nr:aminoacyl-tRNA hydrolase [Caloramator fervidus]SEF79580.1 peptidyl-tRNA hydrolase [Caloramator fervidus]